MSKGYSFTIQDPILAPPEMPTTRVNDFEWTSLCKLDEKLQASYEKKSNQVNIEKITMTGMPKRNRRYWTTFTFSLQTKSPHTTQQYV
jgi:hypothetical protein